LRWWSFARIISILNLIPSLLALANDVSDSTEYAFALRDIALLHLKIVSAKDDFAFAQNQSV
jgi:hypothetical protein